MPRLLAVLLALVAVLLAPAAARAAWFPAEPLDGPGADVVALDDLDIARDGTGAIVWRRLVDGVPHVFLSRLMAGAWRPAERVDGPIPDAAFDASVAVADGGRLAVFWISGSRVYGAYAPAGDAPQPLAGPTLLHAAPDGAPSDGLDAEMGINGTAYGVWRASGGGGADVVGARLKGTDWSTLAAPIDIAASNPAGTGTGRPRVAVDAAGTGLVAWGEAGGVFARRLLGTALSQYPQRVSLVELGEADLPEVDVEEDGSFGWVAFRQLDASGPRAIARRLVGLQFEAPVRLDTGPGAGPPVVSINGRGQGAAIVPAAGAVLSADVSFGNAFTAPGRLDTAGGNGFPDVGIAAADSRDVATAWRTDPGDGGGVVLGRYRVDGQPWEAETVLSRPEFGSVVPGSLLVSGDKNGNTAVAMLQGGEADRRVVVAVNDLPPGRAFPSRGWVREAQPALGWRGGGDPWGVQGYQVLIDGVEAGTTATPGFQPPAPLPDGAHSFQVVTVDRRGQAVPSAVRNFRIDTVPPTGAVRVSGRLRRGSPVTVQVDAADTGSGLAAVVVDYGDRSRRARGARTVHAWTRRGSYVVTAQIADRAGNVTPVSATVRIRR